MALGPLSKAEDPLDVRVVSADATTTGEDAVLVNAGGATVVVTIATADLEDGATLTVADASGSASIANPVLVRTEGSASLGGGPELRLERPGAAVGLFSDGQNWFVSSGASEVGSEPVYEEGWYGWRPSPSFGSRGADSWDGYTGPPSYTSQTTEGWEG